MKLEGVWLPIITPFINGYVDYEAYEKLITHYINEGISGLIPLGTTGESPTICDKEYIKLVDKTMELCEGKIPVYFGLGGNNTLKIVEQVKLLESYKIAGILSVSPYYSRPSQKGIYEHFLKISESTPLNILIYNIPYRTGRNIENETIYKLAELKNIIGIKDSCGNINQTMSLLLNPPKDFSIFTGEDILFYTNLLFGGSGGILASAHIQTKKFLEVFALIKNNDHQGALPIWKELAKFIPLLFEEPNPAPLKYFLHKAGLISSPEVRLPLTEISVELSKKLDDLI